MVIKIRSCKLLNRSRALRKTHINKPNIKKNTLIDREINAIVITVITNDE